MKTWFRLLAIAIAGLSLATASQAQTTLFSDSMENGATGWTTSGDTDGVNDGGLWHVSQRWSTTGTNSWYFGNESTGSVGREDWVEGYLVTPSINLTTVTNATLTFKHRPAGEADYEWDDDYCTVDVTTDNGATWTNVAVGLIVADQMWGGAWANTPNMSIDLSQFAGHTVKISFYVEFTGWCAEHADRSMCPNTEGWYIDDVTVTGH